MLMHVLLIFTWL